MNIRIRIRKNENRSFVMGCKAYKESNFKDGLARLQHSLIDKCRTRLDMIGYKKWKMCVFMWFVII